MAFPTIMVAAQGGLMTTSGSATTWITSLDRTEHAVTEAAFDTGVKHSGEFEAVCGEAFVCASMTVGSARRCSACRRFLAAQQSMTELTARIERPSFLSRLFHRPQTPADAGDPRHPASAGSHSGRGRHAT